MGVTRVYNLTASDEPERVRYVGITEQRLSDRLRGHLTEASSPKYANSHKGRWINAVRARGAVVVITEEGIYPTRRQAGTIEKFRIAEEADLTNATEGGEFGGRHNAETRARMSAAQQKSLLDPVNLESKREISRRPEVIEARRRNATQQWLTSPPKPAHPVVAFKSDGEVRFYLSSAAAAEDTGVTWDHVNGNTRRKRRRFTYYNASWKFAYLKDILPAFGRVITG